MPLPSVSLAASGKMYCVRQYIVYLIFLDLLFEVYYK